MLRWNRNQVLDILQDLGNYVDCKKQSWVPCLSLKESVPGGLIAKSSNFACMFEELSFLLCVPPLVAE